MNPILIDAFAAAGGFWLASVGEDLTPPVSFMGGKRRLARELLALFDLRPGCGLPLLLNDGSWWGWVWTAVLDPDIGPRVSAILRGWRGEDPRALWFRLRDMGPTTDDVAGAAAQLLWLQARAASGVPVWWEGGESRMWDRTRAGNVGPMGQTHASELLAAPGDGRERQRAYERSASTPRLTAGSEGSEGSEGSRSAQAKGVHGGPGRLVQDRGWKTPTCSTRTLYSATQQGADEVADSRRDRRAGDSRAGGGIVDPGTVAARLDDIRDRSPGIVAIENLDALDFAKKWAPAVGRRALVYLDPPYAGATGYALTCPRAKVLEIARTWQQHGARVVLSEAVGLASELGDGWEQVELRRGKKHEWATVYGCDVTAVLPPILRAASRHGSAA